MLEKLNKFAIYIVLGLFGYFTYTVIEAKAISAPEAESMPEITKKMLHPVLLDPIDRSSKANRDPFEVIWDTYFEQSQFNKMFTQTDYQQTLQSKQPIINKKLRAILSDSTGQMVALIGDSVCSTGSFVDPDAPNLCWTVQSINTDNVILSYKNTTSTVTVGSTLKSITPEIQDEKINKAGTLTSPDTIESPEHK